MNSTSKPYSKSLQDEMEKESYVRKLNKGGKVSYQIKKGYDFNNILIRRLG